MAIFDEIKKTGGLIKKAIDSGVNSYIDRLEKSASKKDYYIDPKSLSGLEKHEDQESGYKDRASAVSFDVLRQMAMRNTIVAAIIQCRKNQIKPFGIVQPSRFEVGFKFKMRDYDQEPSDSDKKAMVEMERWLLTCGGVDYRPPHTQWSFVDFLGIMVRDLLIYDQVAIETVPSKDGSIAYFIPSASGSMRIASKNLKKKNESLNGLVGNNFQTSQFSDDEEAKKELEIAKRDAANPDDYRYVQIHQGHIVRGFTDDELILKMMNPVTDLDANGYSVGPLELLANTVSYHLYAEAHNRLFFVQGFASRGILHIEGDIPKKDIEAFRRQWREQISGSSNCLSGDTIIWTPDGAISIDNFLNGELEKQTQVWTGTNWRPALVYETGEKQECKTTLANGSSIVTSPDHKIKIMNDVGELEWKKQSDLKIGDYVAVNATEVTANYNIPEFNGKPLSPEMMEVLGWMIGDGYLINKGKRKAVKLFYHHDKEIQIRDNHFKILSDFGLSAIHSRNTSVTEEEQTRICKKYGFKTCASIRRSIDIYMADFVVWLTSLGFQRSADGKVIPNFISVLPPEYRASFLRGFFSADGNNAKHRSPSITICNDILREQTRTLLLTLGIRTSLSEGKTKIVIDGDKRYYKEAKSYLSIKDRDLFFAKIGFIQDHKQPTELLVLNESNKCDRINPLAAKHFAKLIREEYKGNVGTKYTKADRNMLNAIVCGIDGCSRGRLIREMNKVGMSIPAVLTDYHFEPVVKIERSENTIPMYDLSVSDESHQFMGNGILISNSWRTPILSGGTKINWIALSPSNRDMEWNGWVEYLIKNICAIYSIAPQEINFDITRAQGPTFADSGAKNDSILMDSKIRGLWPILKFFEGIINDNIIKKYDPEFYKKYEFSFCGFHSSNIETELDRIKKESEIYKTINEIRSEHDLEAIEGGDIICNSNYIQWRINEMNNAQMANDQLNQQNAEASANDEANTLNSDIDSVSQDSPDSMSDGDSNSIDEVTKSLTKKFSTPELLKVEYYKK